MQDLWPIPPAHVGRLATPTRGGRRRIAFSKSISINIHLNAVLMVLSYLALGCRRACPSAGRVGRPRTPEQTAVALRLRGSIRSFICSPQGVDSQYPKLDALDEALAEARASAPGSSITPLSSLAGSDFTKATFMKSVSNFDCTKYLDAFSAVCFLQPSLLQPPDSGRVHPEVLAIPEVQAALSTVAKKPRGLFQHGSSAGVLSYLRQWDQHRRLLLLTPAETHRATWGEFFEVFKNDHATRVVFNRIPQNSLELHLYGASLSTPSGHDLTDLHIPQGHVAYLSKDDLSDFYPAFVASWERGRTNTIGKVFALSQFGGLAAHAQFLKTHPFAAPSAKVCAANLGLVMGDLNANDFAIQAHLNLLFAAGVLQPDELMVNRMPFPSGSRIQGVVVDDRFCIDVLPAGDCRALETTRKNFDVSNHAYLQAGLCASPSKHQRAVTAGTVIGAHIDGIGGTVGVEHARTLRLASLSRDIAQSPQISGSILRSGVFMATCLAFSEALALHSG